ncbi:MAG: magnesium/cobalt transporter CorA [Desulfobulbaceae bacterium]
MPSLTSAAGKIGLAPGSLVHVGHPHETETRISVIEYSKETLTTRQVKSVAEIIPVPGKETVTWINVEGLSDVTLIEELGRNFGIHALVLEDILNTHQRPKFEEFVDYLFIALKAISLESAEFTVVYEQISLILTSNVVLTFREKGDDLFLPLRKRLDDDKGRLRTNGADYLAYVLMDTIVDHYFALQDSLDAVIESLDEELLNHPTPATLASIQGLKRELIFIRKTVSPLREMLAEILRSDSGLFRDKVLFYFRDVHDHALRITESVDTYRDMVTGMMEVYLSSISNRTNEIMKVLTVLTSIFIPLTFIVGIYGMNFEHMPELKWKWFYPALWGVFIGLPLMLLWIFRKKKWL